MWAKGVRAIVCGPEIDALVSVSPDLVSRYRGTTTTAVGASSLLVVIPRRHHPANLSEV